MLDVVDNNAAYYYHYDGLGSVVALSDSDADTVQTYEYSIYGQVAASTNFLTNPYMFTGRRFDLETGLYFLRARYYNPHIGRFMQTDPIGYDDGMNLYRYCMNNPLNMVDPSGLCCDSNDSNDSNDVNKPDYFKIKYKKYEWEAPSQPSKIFCQVVRVIPFVGYQAAIDTEAGWCNGMNVNCQVWCMTNDDFVDESDRKKCVIKCSVEHAACLARSAEAKCQMKFKISGFYMVY